MTDRVSILIVEDDELIAMNLAAAVEDRDGIVVGPVASVAAALAELEASAIDAAILDANLIDRDVTPVAMDLIERSIPFVIHTGIGLPAELATVFPHVSVIMKPADPDDVVAGLLDQVGRLRDRKADGATPVGHALGGIGEQGQRIARIAAALFDQFGSKAVVLARRQAADASGDALATWSAIVERLTAREARD